MRNTLRGLKRGYVQDIRTKLKCIVICNSMPSFLLSGLTMCTITPCIILCTRELLDVLKKISAAGTFVATVDDFIEGRSQPSS